MQSPTLHPPSPPHASSATTTTSSSASTTSTSTAAPYTSLSSSCSGTDDDYLATLARSCCACLSVMGAADWLDGQISAANTKSERRGVFGWLAERRKLRADAADARRSRQESEKLRKAEEREERRASRARAKADADDARPFNDPSESPFDRVQQIPIVPYEEAPPADAPGLRADLSQPHRRSSVSAHPDAGDHLCVYLRPAGVVPGG